MGGTLRVLLMLSLVANNVAKASPTPKEVFSFIVVRFARANSERSEESLLVPEGKSLQSLLPQDDSIKVVLVPL